MAFNNWEKLSKAQADYPKPKFAVAVVDKALKKSPKNPFLLAWRTDLSLQQNADPKLAVDRLMQISQDQAIADPRLLSYLYKLSIEATRRSLSGARNVSSIGNGLLKPWQNAAKTLNRRVDRLQLWGALFNIAMREDCWEDVRFAVVNYNKEAPPSKKLAHYTLILALQLAATQKQTGLKSDDPMAKMQLTLARKLMKQAYEATPDDPIAVKDIRDLRFMADIFGQQGQLEELFALWDNPPTALKDLMMTHRDDLLSVKTRILKQHESWELLEKHCLACIDQTISQLNANQDSKSLWELCAWRWDLWNALLDAIANLRPGKEGVDQVSEIMGRCFGTEVKANDRPLRLLSMFLRRFTGFVNLSDCKEYWTQHSSLLSCFADLRPVVEILCVNDQKEFSKFILDEVRGVLNKGNIGKDLFGKWQIAELNVLKTNYLLTISSPRTPTFEALEAFIIKAIDFCNMLPTVHDGGHLVIYALLHLHHQVICQKDQRFPFEMTVNSRVLLQATMLARHLVACDTGKENRTLSLLAARLHLNLGLGKCAFQLYSRARCKEMLLDTLSPYVLSRISLTHPFDIKGYQAFSPDEELAKVVSTIERMEKKVDGYVYVEMTSFQWDQASDSLELKRKLNSSLTKHICVTERRRIARLRGESTEDLPSLKYNTYTNISDNVDKSVFLNVESTNSNGPFAFVMPNGIPNVKSMIDSHCERETASRTLYREGNWQDFEPWRTNDALHSGKGSELANRVLAEVQLANLWKGIRIFTVETFFPGVNYPGSQQRNYGEEFVELMAELHAIRKALEKLRMPGSTTLKPEDEPAMFHENMLIYCYVKLEALRALHKLIEHLREKVVSPKSTHLLKAKLPKNGVNDLAEEVQICFQAIRDLAQSYIHLIETKGEAAIKAQVRWGKTGEALRKLISNDSLHGYAKEYVESALEAWNGVLKVKLK